MTVIDLDTRRLGATDFAFAERAGDGTWGTSVECWTKFPLGEVLGDEHRTAFLRPMTHFARVGDQIDAFQVGDMQRPERDPLAMVTLIVTHFETDRHGTQMRTARYGDTLRFNGVTGKGIEHARWRGKEAVYRDGVRVGEWNTRIEAVEQFERLRDPKADGDKFSASVAARLAELKAQPPPRVLLPASHRCKHEDIAVVGFRKISRVVEVRTLDAIEDVIVDSAFFCVAKSRFRTGDRVSFTRFDSDARHRVIEILPLALADIDAGRVRFYPQMAVSICGSPETGFVRETINGRVHLRENGRTVETFANDERCDWHCADKGIVAVEFQVRRAA